MCFRAGIALAVVMATTMAEETQRQQHQPLASLELMTIFVLGIFIGGAFCMALTRPDLSSLSGYLGFLSLFHALEYLITKTFQPTRASFDCTKHAQYVGLFYFLAFLLNHSNEYSASVFASVCEYAVEAWMFPRLKSWLCCLRFFGMPCLSFYGFLFFALGICMAVIGQAIRSAGMIEAKDNFSHQIAEKKEPGHRLVTSGIYAYIRHPSYIGFFIWTLGLQLMLGNPLCLISFYRILVDFFRERIQYEEGTLTKFFPDEHPRYKAATWSGFLDF
jgi:protein-S-isoprenylcysteine O-methyltransferase